MGSPVFMQPAICWDARNLWNRMRENALLVRLIVVWSLWVKVMRGRWRGFKECRRHCSELGRQRHWSLALWLCLSLVPKAWPRYLFPSFLPSQHPLLNLWVPILVPHALLSCTMLDLWLNNSAHKRVHGKSGVLGMIGVMGSYIFESITWRWVFGFLHSWLNFMELPSDSEEQKSLLAWKF